MPSVPGMVDFSMKFGAPVPVLLRTSLFCLAFLVIFGVRPDFVAAQDSQPASRERGGSLDEVAPLPATAPPGGPRTAVILPTGAGARERRVLEATLASAGRTVVDVSDEAILGSLALGAIPRVEVAALADVERLLDEFRAHRLALQDQQALHALGSAKRILLRHPSLPGVAKWLVEVEIAHGILAAQRGDLRVSERALRRSLVLDPARVVRLGEAPPTVVALSARLQQELRDAPSASMRLEVPGIAGARVYVDDEDVGEAPVYVEVKSGRHLVRVEAVGYLTLGWAEDFAVGEQPPVRVQLPVHPARDASQALRGAIADHALARVRRTLPDLGLDEVWWLSRRTDEEKWLLGHCKVLTCFSPARLTEVSSRSLGETVVAAQGLALDEEAEVNVVAAYAAAERWLAAPRWHNTADEGGSDAWLWGGAAAIAAVVGITVMALVLASESQAPSLQVHVDPCAVATCR